MTSPLSVTHLPRARRLAIRRPIRRVHDTRVPSSTMRTLTLLHVEMYRLELRTSQVMGLLVTPPRGR
jgi:hypothetical protein